jgi:hypothetical protein
MRPLMGLSVCPLLILSGQPSRTRICPLLGNSVGVKFKTVNRECR